MFESISETGPVADQFESATPSADSATQRGVMNDRQIQCAPRDEGLTCKPTAPDTLNSYVISIPRRHLTARRTQDTGPSRSAAALPRPDLHEKPVPLPVSFDWNTVYARFKSQHAECCEKGDAYAALAVKASIDEVELKVMQANAFLSAAPPMPPITESVQAYTALLAESRDNSGADDARIHAIHQALSAINIRTHQLCCGLDLRARQFHAELSSNPRSRPLGDEDVNTLQRWLANEARLANHHVTGIRQGSSGEMSTAIWLARYFTCLSNAHQQALDPWTASREFYVQERDRAPSEEAVARSTHERLLQAMTMPAAQLVRLCEKQETRLQQRIHVIHHPATPASSDAEGHSAPFRCGWLSAYNALKLQCSRHAIRQQTGNVAACQSAIHSVDVKVMQAYRLYFPSSYIPVQIEIDTVKAYLAMRALCHSLHSKRDGPTIGMKRGIARNLSEIDKLTYGHRAELVEETAD